MTDEQKLPRGIRNNNPGNLRSGYAMPVGVPKEDGFAHFATMDDGLYSLAMLVHHYYSISGLKTVSAFIQRYAPSSENDVMMYEKAVAARIRFNSADIGTKDLRLMDGWRAFDFIRAIISVENGNPPASLPSFPEWIRPSELLSAMIRTRQWGAL